MGAIQRLQNIASAAQEHGINRRLPDDVHSIRTVADVRRLVALTDHDPQLDDDVRNTLGLSRSKWAGVKHTAQQAVEPDTR